MKLDLIVEYNGVIRINKVLTDECNEGRPRPNIDLQGDRMVSSKRCGGGKHSSLIVSIYSLFRVLPKVILQCLENLKEHILWYAQEPLTLGQICTARRGFHAKDTSHLTIDSRT